MTFGRHIIIQGGRYRNSLLIFPCQKYMSIAVQGFLRRALPCPESCGAGYLLTLKCNES